MGGISPHFNLSMENNMMNGVKMCSKRLEFIQDPDGLQEGFNDQLLFVEVNDGGGGPYVLNSSCHIIS